MAAVLRTRKKSITTAFSDRDYLFSLLSGDIPFNYFPFTFTYLARDSPEINLFSLLNPLFKKVFRNACFVLDTPVNVSLGRSKEKEKVSEVCFIGSDSV